MVTLEDYELSYALYTEGRILESTSTMIELKSLTESSEYITEAIKDNIKAYVNKIIAAIQKVWNKFKDNVNKAKLNWKAEDIQKAINENPVNVEVENYIKYDPSRLDSISIVEFNYSIMKESLDSKDEFLKKYYGSSFFTDSSKSVAENIKAKCIVQKSDKYKLTKDDLQSMFNYMKSHKDIIDKLGKELDKVNRASKSVDLINVNSNSGNEGTTTPNNSGPSNESALMYYHEDDEAPKATSTETREDGSSSKSSGNADATRVQNYFKATTEILSAEMSISREIYKYYEQCINVHMKNAKNKKPANSGDQTTATDNGNAQVNI